MNLNIPYRTTDKYGGTKLSSMLSDAHACKRALLKQETTMNNQTNLKAASSAQFTPSAERRYFSANDYFKKLFGKKTYKLSFDAGFNCPNRDGKISYGGCIFCSEGGSGDFAVKLTADNLQNIDDAFAEAKARVSEKIRTNSYIAYFQSYSNTYAPTETLEKLFSAVIARSDVCALSIATRPDCFTDETYNLIKRLCEVKPIFVELGLQTANEKTAEYINRGYNLPVYDQAVARLKTAGGKRYNARNHRFAGRKQNRYFKHDKTCDRCGHGRT